MSVCLFVRERKKKERKPYARDEMTTALRNVYKCTEYIFLHEILLLLLLMSGMII